MGASNCSEFVRQYLGTALWSSGDEFDEYMIDDFAPEAVRRAVADCDAFLDSIDHVDLEAAWLGRGDAFIRAAHDFCLTRNRHGVGFWDGDWSEPAASILTEAAHRAGEVNIYVGDDGRLHFA